MSLDHHELRVFSGDVQLKPIDKAGTITADRGWSPQVQGRLTVKTPEPVATTEPGSLITIELTQRFGDFALTRDLSDAHGGDLTSDLTSAFAGGTTADLTALITAGSWVTPVRAATGRTFHLIVTERARSRETVTMELASREVLFQDWLWYDVDGNLEGLPLEFTAETAGQYLERIIDAHRRKSFTYFSGGFDDDIPVLLIPSAFNAAAIAPTTHTIQTGEGTFAALKTILTNQRAVIYSDGDNTVQVGSVNRVSAGSIELEHGINLIDWEITDARARTTLVRFTGTDVDPEARPIYSSSPFPEIPRPHEQLIEAPHKPFLTSGLVSGVTAQVSPYLQTIGLDDSPIRLVAVNDYSVMPGSSISYTLPGEDEETDSIDAISWQLGDRFEMNIWT